MKVANCVVVVQARSQRRRLYIAGIDAAFCPASRDDGRAIRLLFWRPLTEEVFIEDLLIFIYFSTYSE